LAQGDESLRSQNAQEARFLELRAHVIAVNLRLVILTASFGANEEEAEFLETALIAELEADATTRTNDEDLATGQHRGVSLAIAVLEITTKGDDD
jgi:hypothetical protein